MFGNMRAFLTNLVSLILSPIPVIKTAELSCFEVQRPRRFESLFCSHGEELDFAAGRGGFCVTEFSGNHTAINGEAFCRN